MKNRAQAAFIWRIWIPFGKILSWIPISNTISKGVSAFAFPLWWRESTDGISDWALCPQPNVSASLHHSAFDSASWTNYQNKQYQRILKTRASNRACTAKEAVWTIQELKTSLVYWKANVLPAKNPVYRTLQTRTNCIFEFLQEQTKQGKIKRLAACTSQTASPFGCLNSFQLKIWSLFLGSLHSGPAEVCLFVLAALKTGTF